MRRESMLKRGVARNPMIRQGDRMAHVLQMRDGDPLNGFLSASHSGLPTNFAGDLFTIYSTIEIGKNTGLRGSGYATELFGSAGPLLKVTASNVVIEDMRFVRSATIRGQSLIPRPILDPSPVAYSQTLDLSMDSAAIWVTGSNVTIRNCWFEGFDNAIYVNAYNVTVENCRISGGENSSQAGVLVAGPGAHVTGCHIDNTAYGIFVTRNNCLIQGNTVEATETGIFVISDYTRIHGNHVEGMPLGMRCYSATIRRIVR